MRPALVLVTTSYPSSGDGREAAGGFVADLAEEISYHLPVRVVAPGPINTCESPAPNLDVFRYAASDKPLSTLKPWRPRDLAEIVAVLRSGQQATDRAVCAGTTAHILALWALPSGYWARRAAKHHGLHYSVWTLGSDIWTLGRIPLVRRQLARVLKDATVCYSDGLQLADDTRRISGRDVEFLPSTRRIERTRTAPLKTHPPYRLLFLGRWHPNKGIDLLLEALALLDEADWQRIEAVEIFGGGPMEAQVDAAVARLRAHGRPVELGGYLDKPAAEAAILRADYLLIPSRIESIPVVFSDAMKLGCPVVSMPTGDLPRLVADEPCCGVIADEITSKAFGVALSRALAQPPQRFLVGTRAVAEKFDLARVSRCIRTVMEVCPNA